MDVNTLINDLVEAIAGDSVIETWCQAQYGKSVQVFTYVDLRNPPAADDCPCVCVTPVEKQYPGREYADAVDMTCIVHDRSTRTHDGYDNILEYVGTRNVEALRKLVLSVLADLVAATDASRIDQVSVDYDTISMFPFMLASQAAAVVTPYTVGSGNPAKNE